MTNDKFVKVGWWGTAITGICCVTPILPWVFGLIGLAAVTAYLDYVLLPLLFLFVGIALWGWWRASQVRKVKG